ncbi:rRNA maturation RNase YbeY [candidate division Kazan bacterium RBG_13_50_9]|uniref:Endoribonuclease YbeY n=1 Tax=candidate division Kazan bacterium RBG_13_50_9 TaxID=1798535 RepID=A0A1F4NSI2_UNCK3|nr:MAG: rRNA maturation RNase YbeY [candidate division Kazan bacterium RBG_13_50_9]
MAKVFIGYDTYGVKGVDEEFVHFIFDMVLAHTASSPDSEVGLVVTSDEHIRALNHQYRGKDRLTNVLSFANDEIEGFISAADDKGYLGDIYMSYPQLLREAHTLSISSRERFIQLFVHGALHLLGFDHEETQDAGTMEQLEEKIMSSIL